MFFLPQTQRLVVKVARKGHETSFSDALLPVLFVYTRPECRVMSWAVKSAYIAQTGAALEPQWWSVDPNDQVKDDLPKDGCSSSTYYAPTLTFRGQKFGHFLATCKSGPSERDRALYLAIVSSGRVQLDVEVNKEVRVPLVFDLEYQLIHVR